MAKYPYRKGQKHRRSRTSLPYQLTRGPAFEKNKGIITHTPHGADYISGVVSGIPSTILNEYGDWRPWLPTYERQHTRVFNSMAAVSFSALNCLETIHNFRYGTEVNYSDRFLAKCSGTSRFGNSMRCVGDTIRSVGLVHEDQYPFPAMAVWDTYYSPVPADVMAQARRFRETYVVGYEFITDLSDNNLRHELKKGPLQVSIGSQVIEAHAVELLYVQPDGTKWIFDHYKTGLTYLIPGRRIYSALRYHYINKNEVNKRMLDIPNNTLVFMIEPPVKFGLHVDGKMYVDNSTSDLVAQWVKRNEKNGVFSGGPTKDLSLYEFNLVPQYTLNNEPIPHV